MGSALSKIFSAWSKSAQAKRLARLLVFCVLFALYVLFFPLLHQTFGWMSVSFSWCFIGISVWFWGLRGGVAVGVWWLDGGWSQTTFVGRTYTQHAILFAIFTQEFFNQRIGPAHLKILCRNQACLSPYLHCKTVINTLRRVIIRTVVFYSRLNSV